MPPRLQAVPWGSVLVGSAAGTLLLLVVAGATPAGTALLPLAVALLAGAAAFVLDEPAAAAVDATPTSLRARTAGRAPVALVPLGCGALALTVAGQRSAAVSIGGTVLVLAGCLLAGVAVSSGLRRRVAAPGETAAAVVGLTLIAATLFEPLSRWVVVLPLSPHAPWGPTAALWCAISIGSLAVLAWTTRDPLSRRGPSPGPGSTGDRAARRGRSTR